MALSTEHRCVARPDELLQTVPASLSAWESQTAKSPQTKHQDGHRQVVWRSGRALGVRHPSADFCTQGWPLEPAGKCVERAATPAAPHRSARASGPILCDCLFAAESMLMLSESDCDRTKQVTAGAVRQGLAARGQLARRAAGKALPLRNALLLSAVLGRLLRLLAPDTSRTARFWSR